MAITIETLRRFSGTGRMLLNAQGDGLRSVGILQRLKSFFGFGDARQKNADTLSAIRDAFLNDPRFAPEDLKKRAKDLLDGVRTDRAINAKQIRGIVNDMLRLTNRQFDTVTERVMMHLAAGAVPVSLEKFPAEAEEIALAYVHQVAQSTAASGGVLDVAGHVKEAMDLCERAVSRVRRNDEVADPMILDIVGKNLKQLVMKGDDTLRSPNDVERAVSQMRDFYFRAQADARRLTDSHFERSADLVAVQAHSGALVNAAVELLRKHGPVPPDFYDRTKAYMANVPYYDLARLGPASSADEVFAAFHNLEMYFEENPIRDSTGESFSRGNISGEAIGKFMAKMFLLRLPESVRDHIYELLKVPAVGKAFDRVVVGSGTSGAGYADLMWIQRILGNLEEVTGRNVSFPSELGEERLRRATSVDLKDFSLVARTAYDERTSMTGNESSRLHAAIFTPLSNALALDQHGLYSTAVFKRRLAAGAQTMLDGVFARGMKALASGDPAVLGGIVPGGTVDLPDGVTLLGGLAALQDSLACLMTGRGDATYAQLDPAAKARVNVLSVLVSADAGEAAETGMSVALSADGGREAIRADGDVERQFKISGSPAEGFHIRCSSHRTPHTFTIVPQPPAAHETIAAGAGSHLDTQFDIFLTPADMDRLAANDWSAFDSAALDGAVTRPDLNLAAVSGAVPQNFHIGGTLFAAFQANVNKVQA